MALRQRITAAGVTDIFNMRLIEFLVQRGMLPSADIETFIGQAREHGHSLTAHAVTSGIAQEIDLLRITAALHNMEMVTLSTVEVEESLARLLRPEQALDWRVLPYSRNDLGELLIAISDPDDVGMRENVTRSLPRERVKFMVASPSELNLYIEHIFGGVQQAAVAQSVEQAVARTALAGGGETFVVRSGGSDVPIIRLVDDMIDQARRSGASDIHIEPKEAQTNVRFRIDGRLREISAIPPRLTPQVISRIKTVAGMRIDERRLPQDGRITMMLQNQPIELRVVTAPTIYGEQVTMRLLDPAQAMLSLEALGMSKANLERYLRAINQPFGCAFITGPTGSGKSTTLYSSLQRIVTPDQKIVSIEDPVEYRMGGISQMDVSGSAKMNFAQALRSILRSDPDIIMVGEIRDQETALISIEAALTGHFLYSTLHTHDALSAIIRLERLGVERFLVAEATSVIVAQRLIRRLCDTCRQEFAAGPDYLRGLLAPAWAIEQAADHPLRFFQANPRGCAACQGQGYRGRTGVHEVVAMTEQLRHDIIAGHSVEELELLVRGQKMASLRDDAFTKVYAGLTSMEEMARTVGTGFAETNAEPESEADVDDGA
jgi:type IV pilus assembly protein PilB